MKVQQKPLDDAEWKLLKWLCKRNHLRPHILKEFSEGIKIHKALLN